jgi:PHD/YefM family antitoxin component YafN of YafNO toxin-antitoxin module
MENTSPKELRAKLKEFLDLAKKEAVRIKRRSGQNYILISEEKYNELKLELTSLQKRLLGKNHVADEKIVEKSKKKSKDKSSEQTKVKAKDKTKKDKSKKDKTKDKKVKSVKIKKDKVKKIN